MVVGTIFSAPGQTIGVSVFTDHLIDSLGISRLSISTAYMIGTVLSSLFIGYAGIAIDRIGIRPIAAVSSLGLGIILLYMSTVDRISTWLINFTKPELSQIIPLIMVTIGFFFMRFFGQGVLTLASRTLLMEWFVKRRGRINGIAGVFISLMFSGSPLVFEKLINSYTWRGAWQIMGIVIGIGVTLFIIIFFRDKPENCDLQPDGFIENATNKISETEETNYTLKYARKTYIFWAYNLALSMFSLVMTAITFHLISIFKSHNLIRMEAISIFLPTAIISLFLHLIVGFLSDFTSLKYYLFLIIGGLILSLSGILMLDYSWGKYLIIVGNGIAGGMFGTLATVTWPRFFGRKHLGAINGLSMQFLVFFSAIGPFLFGLSFDITGNYKAAVLFCIIVLVILLMFSLKPGGLDEKN